MHSIHPQLPLGFEPSELFTFDSLVAGQNEVLIEAAKKMIEGSGETQLFVWGETDSGKSHLLQACCNLSARLNKTLCYLTDVEIRQYDTDSGPDIFDGLEQLDLICLDNLDRWLSSDQWQMALFNLINRVRESGGKLIMSSAIAPDSSFVSLPDLKSRLAWGPVFQMNALDDDDKFKALRHRANQNGLDMPESVARYLIERYPRDMSGLFERLAILDQAAMSAQRKLTIPLVKSVFNE